MQKRNLAIGGGILAVLAIIIFAVTSGGGDSAAPTTTTEATTTTTEPPPPVSSLTGLETTEEIHARPVVAIKYDNVDGKSTPQVGINSADVVYEIQVEGQVTRLLALFQSTDAAPIGPVRSARGSEIGVLEELNSPLFTWHGENQILGPQVRASSIQARSINEISQLFYRQSGRPAPYNSFVQGSAEIRATADEGSTGPPNPIFQFAAEGEAPSPRAVPATTVNITFPVPFGGGGGGSPVTYNWDAATSKWLRTQAGHAHVDGDGVQIAADNVVIRFVDAIDSGTVDLAGSRVPTAQVIGEGEVWVFSQGTVTTGRWKKADGVSATQYLDPDGVPIKLTPGKTWLSMPYSSAGSSFG